MNMYDKIKERTVYELAEEEHEQDASDNPTFSEEENKTVAPAETPYSSDIPMTPEEEYSNPSPATESGNPTIQSGNAFIREEIHKQTIILLQYAKDYGIELPPKLGALVESEKLDDLIQVHQLVTAAIEPATPKTVVYLYHMQEKRGLFKFISPIPVVRSLVIIAIISAVCMIGSGLSTEVNPDSMSKSILSSDGYVLFINMFFLLSAAGVGAAFSLLSKVTREVKTAVFDPESHGYCWSMLVMGILSGLILSEIVGQEDYFSSETLEANRMLLAILGGFSSEAVYCILQQVMERIQVLLPGSGNKS